MKYEITVEQEKEYDVIVVGSGPSGVAAAITSGRGGAKTLLVESLGRVGGISTSGLMSHFTGTCDNQIYHETLKRAAEKNPFAQGEVTHIIDPELLTLTYIEMLEEAGVEIILYTSFCDVLMDENGQLKKESFRHEKPEPEPESENTPEEE